MKTNFALMGDFRNVKLEMSVRMWAACARMVFAPAKPIEQLFSRGESGKICAAMYNNKINPSQLMKSRLAEELELTCEIDCPLQLGTLPPRLRAFGPHWIFNSLGQDGIFYGVVGDGSKVTGFNLILASGPTIEPMSDMKTWGRFEGSDTLRANVIFSKLPWTGGVTDTTTYTPGEQQAAERKRRDDERYEKLHPSRNQGGGMKG